VQKTFTEKSLLSFFEAVLAGAHHGVTPKTRGSTMVTDELLLDELVDEPEDLFTIPEIKRELAHEHRDEELGLRGLLEQPERALPDRLSRLRPPVFYRVYDWNSAVDDEVSSAA
jgi:hypothetical protein